MSEVRALSIISKYHETPKAANLFSSNLLKLSPTQASFRSPEAERRPVKLLQKEVSPPQKSKLQKMEKHPSSKLPKSIED